MKETNIGGSPVWGNLRAKIETWVDGLRLPEDVEAKELLARGILEAKETGREDPFGGIRFTWLMAAQVWAEDRIGAFEQKLGNMLIAEWERAVGRKLSEEEIRDWWEQALKAFTTGDPNLMH